MAYVIYYRKPKYHKTYPWTDMKDTAEEALEFINFLGEDYDFRIFEEIDLTTLEEIVDELSL